MRWPWEYRGKRGGIEMSVFGRRWTDNHAMACFTCDRSPVWRQLSRAAAKSAGARIRALGLLPVRVDWAARAAMCEQCPIRMIRAGVSYCGRPLLDQVRRLDSIDGCGCPTIAKAKDPAEHCPLNASHHPASEAAGRCNCKWCGKAAN